MEKSKDESWFKMAEANGDVMEIENWQFICTQGSNIPRHPSLIDKT